MDCEKFETLLIDELYGELDEVTSAAVRRHAAGCARCGALLSGLRATRKVAALPMEEPSDDLEDRILAAVREKQKVLPFRARASTALSRAGAWAMRPQTAMAAVFLLVIGTSFVLVQSRSQDKGIAASTQNASEGTPMAVKNGAPAASAFVLDGNESAFAHGIEEQRDRLQTVATASPPAATAALGADGEKEKSPIADLKKADDSTLALNDKDLQSAQNAGPIAGAGGGVMRRAEERSRGVGKFGGSTDDPHAATRGGGGWSSNAETTMPQAQAQQPYGSGSVNFGTAKQLYDQGKYDEARVQWDNLGDASSLLWAGRSLKAQGGCTAAAIQRFDGASQKAGSGSAVGKDALLEAARCYRQMGNTQLARARYSTIIGQGGQPAQVAQTELDSMTPVAAAHRSAPPVSRDQAATTTARPTTPAGSVTAAPAQKAAGY